MNGDCDKKTTLSLYCFMLLAFLASLLFALQSMRCRFKKQYLLAAWNLMGLPYPLFKNHFLNSACPSAAQSILLNPHKECLHCVRPVSKSESDPVEVIIAVASNIPIELRRGTQVFGSLFFVLTMSSSYCSDGRGGGAYDYPFGSSFTKALRN